MSDPVIDGATFAFLGSCVGDFVRRPQCKSVNLWGDNIDGRLSEIHFEVRATNPDDRTTFKIIVKNDDVWRVRIVQVSNHVILDERNADRATIVSAVNRFTELAGMREG